MPNLLTILLLLFLALVIVIPLVERFSKNSRDINSAGLARWVLPLVLVLLILQLLFYWVG